MAKLNAKAFLDAQQDWIRSQNDKLYEALYQTFTKQVVDHAIYATKLVGQVTSFYELFKQSDTPYVGLTNLTNAKLNPDEYFALTAIQLQYAVAAGTSDAQVAAATYGVIPDAVKNGEFSLLCDKRVILDVMSSEVFHNAGVAIGDTNASAATPVTYTMTECGIFELDAPKLLNPQEVIKMELKFAAALASANSCLKVTLRGAKIVAL